MELDIAVFTKLHIGYCSSKFLIRTTISKNRESDIVSIVEVENNGSQILHD